MKLTIEDMSYLDDRKYSNAYKFKPIFKNNDFKYISKIEFLKNLIRDKRIIHLGCVDHNIETIEYKIKKNKWLHKHLVESASYTLGIDIKEKEISYIKKQYSYDVEVMDITSPDKSLFKNNYDFLLLPDVIEHIGNPVNFLTKIRENNKQIINKIVITVPNAFYKQNFSFSKKDFEIINSDHRFWFTPYSICKLLTDSGYKIEDIYMYNKASLVRKTSFKKVLYNFNLLRKYIFKDSIFSRLGIIVIAKF